MSKKTIRVLIVSRFTPWKQVDRVSQIAQYLASYPIEFWIVGGGTKEEERKIKKAINCHRPGLRVKFVGEISPRTVYRQFLKADIYLSLACYEPFSVALIEAHAAGLPSVSADVSGNPEILADGISGFLYREGDWQMAAKKIEKLITDRQLYCRMSQNAIGIAQNYNIRNNITTLKRFYNRAL